MPDAIERARNLIEARLRELEAESRRLDAALQSLRPGRPAKPRRGARRKPTSRSQPKRHAARGQRRRQFLAAVEKNPGAKPAEIAAKIGISPNQAHTLARRLRQQKAIRKSGKGYRVTAKVEH